MHVFPQRANSKWGKICFWVLFLVCLVLLLWIAIDFDIVKSSQGPIFQIVAELWDGAVEQTHTVRFCYKIEKKYNFLLTSVSNLKTIFSFSIWCLRCLWASLRRARPVLQGSSSGQPWYRSIFVFFFLFNPWSAEVGLFYWQTHTIKQETTHFPASLTQSSLSQSCYFHYRLIRNVFSRNPYSLG